MDILNVLVLLARLSQAELAHQVIVLDGSRDIDVDYTLTIDADAETMALSMSAEQGVWMGVILGSENMSNAPCHVYYEDSVSGWMFTERYMDGEDKGELVEEIAQSDYSVVTVDGTTTLRFTRPWTGSHSTSFTLTSDAESIKVCVASAHGV